MAGRTVYSIVNM